MGLSETRSSLGILVSALSEGEAISTITRLLGVADNAWPSIIAALA